MYTGRITSNNRFRKKALQVQLYIKVITLSNHEEAQHQSKTRLVVSIFFHGFATHGSHVGGRHGLPLHRNNTRECDDIFRPRRTELSYVTRTFIWAFSSFLIASFSSIVELKRLSYWPDVMYERHKPSSRRSTYTKPSNVEKKYDHIVKTTMYLT